MDVISLEVAKETISILSQRTCEYLIEDMSLSIENTSVEPQDIDSFTLESYTALINLKYDMFGTIGFSVSTQLARYMVGQFVFGEVTDEEVEEMAGDCVAEVLNVVLGNVIKEFRVLKDGGKVDISTPYVMSKTTKIAKAKAGLMVVSQYETNHGKLILTFFG